MEGRYPCGGGGDGDDSAALVHETTLTLSLSLSHTHTYLFHFCKPTASALPYCLTAWLIAVWSVLGERVGVDEVSVHCLLSMVWMGSRRGDGRQDLNVNWVWAAKAAGNHKPDSRLARRFVAPHSNPPWNFKRLKDEAPSASRRCEHASGLNGWPGWQFLDRQILLRRLSDYAVVGTTTCYCGRLALSGRLCACSCRIRCPDVPVALDYRVHFFTFFLRVSGGRMCDVLMRRVCSQRWWWYVWLRLWWCVCVGVGGVGCEWCLCLSRCMSDLAGVFWPLLFLETDDRPRPQDGSGQVDSSK